MKTLLQIVQEHADRQGLPRPQMVIGSTNAYARQAKGLLNEWLEDMSTYKAWEKAIRRTEWLMVNSEDQGSLDTLAPAAYDGIIPETTYLSGYGWPIRSASQEEWAALKSSVVTGLPYLYYLQGGRFLTNVPYTAGAKFSFQYYSKAYVYLAAQNGEPERYKTEFTNDNDVPLLDDRLALAYLRWAWRREKGFDYAEEFRKYQMLLTTISARSDSPQPMSMDPCENRAIKPGIFVPNMAIQS